MVAKALHVGLKNQRSRVRFSEGAPKVYGGSSSVGRAGDCESPSVASSNLVCHPSIKKEFVCLDWNICVIG